ncbi:MAG TPA: hypothetical protein VHZ06_10325 [Marmoricola sp.]|jgi:hypothetical protein|nr:hypothetical protein [Marmoricola sp.]
MHTLVRRTGATIASAALIVSGAALLSAPAQAATQPQPVTQAADWLAGQLTNGLIHNPNYDGGFDDYGLSIDTAMALDAVGGHDADVHAIGNAIRDNYYNYITPSLEFNDPTSYGGAIAKALVIAQVADTLPANYDSTVLGDLESQVATAAPIAGRIQNVGETDFNTGLPTDSANVVSQGLTARALVTAGASDASDALDFLLEQQCTGANQGFFRLDLTADKAASDQTCGGASPAATPDIDTTALVMLDLQAIPASPAITTSLTQAATWLKAQQAADGSFDSDNANSTGLAAWALGASPEATKAADWLRDHQADNTDACTKLAGSVGAIAFDDASLAAGRANGIPTTDVENGIQDQFRRATSQALPALQYVSTPAPASLTIAGPSGYVKAGSAAAYQVGGAAAGSKLCVTTGSSSKAGTASGTGTASVALTLPAGTATRTVTVTDRDGNTKTVSTKVLGAKTLTVKPGARKVRKGKKVTVTVSGLAAGEQVTLRYRGAVVASGTATSTGTFARAVKVGKKLGSAKLTASGQFADIRSGSTTIKVTR